MGFHDRGMDLNGQDIELHGRKVGYHEDRLFTIIWYQVLSCGTKSRKQEDLMIRKEQESWLGKYYLWF